jgi:hypothetical protein
MDAVTLDHLLGEVGPQLRGRAVRRVRAAGGQALLIEIDRSVLWLDVGRETSGLYLLDRKEAERLREAVPGAPDARSRHALLHFKKHIEGRRLGDCRRIAGERAVVFEAEPATVWLRLARPAVATLAIEQSPLAGFGGDPAWPPPAADEGRAWPRLTAETVAAAAAAGDRGPGALLAACPELGAQVARRLVRDPPSWAVVRERLASPRPLVALPGPREALSDADLGSAELWPCALDDTREPLAFPTWSEAAATFLDLRLCGMRFTARRRPLLDAAASKVRRLAQLERHLGDDLQGLPAEETLRRQGEALLASDVSDAAGQSSIELADPYDPAVRLHVRLDPRLSLPANADRLFEKARRAARARVQVAARLDETREALRDARAHEERLRSARRLDDLPEPQAERPADEAVDGPRRFLTSRGLMLLVGRGARENHELTFKVAGPEDFWLHARDVPGAHVILRDPERRAAPEDLREAAEVAAFFSGARTGGPVDVHVTRRKHVQPAGGGAGRVRISHSETERVTPRDPEGRLRKR